MGLVILPGEWGVQVTFWATQPWGPTAGRQVPLAGLKTNGTYRKAVRNQDSAVWECTHTHLLTPRKNMEAAGWKLPGLWPACWDHPSMQPSPYQAPALAPLALAVLVWRCCCQGECAHLKGMELAQTQPSGLPLQSLEPHAHPWEGSDCHWAEEKPWLTRLRP